MKIAPEIIVRAERDKTIEEIIVRGFSELRNNRALAAKKTVLRENTTTIVFLFLEALAAPHPAWLFPQ